MSTLQLSSCLIMRGEKFLLLKRKDSESWELPGGKVDDGSEPEDVVCKQAEEQLGVQPTIIQQFDILEYQDSERNVTNTVYECDLENNDVASSEFVEVKWTTAEEASQLPLSNSAKQVLEEL